eukprot:8778851-Pyramimonas_sp.AAC.1
MAGGIGILDVVEVLDLASGASIQPLAMPVPRFRRPHLRGAVGLHSSANRSVTRLTVLSAVAGARLLCKWVTDLVASTALYLGNSVQGHPAPARALNEICGSTVTPPNGGAFTQQGESVSAQETCDVSRDVCSSCHTQTRDQHGQNQLPVPSTGNSKFVISLCDAIPASLCPSVVTDSRPINEGQA